jgi:hypothetical protein
MPIHRVTCAECGLSATYIQNGDRGLTSFLEESAAELCVRGQAAASEEQSVLERVVNCDHLTEAIAAAVFDPKRTAAG